MRLIDIDVALRKLRSRRESYLNSTSPEYTENLECSDMLSREPIVEVTPVVHAHWEDGWGEDYYGKEVYKSIDCSHCNEIFKTNIPGYWKERFKVCPFCGALMDKEVDSNED